MLILSKVLYFFKIMKVGVLRSMASPNRVGSCLWKFICILIRGHKRKILLRESHCKFRNTLFCKAFFNYIKQYNMLIRSGKKEKDEVIELITHGQLELCTLPQITCQEIQSDIYSYFREKIYDKITPFLDREISLKKYVIPNNWKKRVCVHLRLDDCAKGQHSVDYDGRTSHNYFTEKLEGELLKVNENIGPGHIGPNRPSTFDIQDYRNYFAKKKIRVIGRGISCYQSPIPHNRMNALIEKIKKDYPEHEIVIIASPKHAKENNEDIKHNYKIIRTPDPDIDLLHLVFCDVLVCSRSTYAMVAAFFHKGSKVIMPQWGYTGGAGLGSKYDKSGFELYY